MSKTAEGMTLQQCKDEVARKYGYASTTEAMSNPSMRDEAAELYAQQRVSELAKENQNLRTAIDAQDKLRVQKTTKIKELEQSNKELVEAIESMTYKSGDMILIGQRGDTEVQKIVYKALSRFKEVVPDNKITGPVVGVEDETPFNDAR